MLLRVRRQQSVVAKSSWLPAMRTCKRNGSYKSPHRMLSCCRLKECAVGYAEILLLSLRRHRSSSADHRWNDPMIKRILISLAITWVAATTLGIILGARVLGTASITNLWGAGVVQMAAMLCTGTALFLTPLTAWAKKLCFYQMDFLPLVAVGIVAIGNARAHPKRSIYHLRSIFISCGRFNRH